MDHLLFWVFCSDLVLNYLLNYRQLCDAYERWQSRSRQPLSCLQQSGSCLRVVHHVSGKCGQALRFHEKSLIPQTHCLFKFSTTSLSFWFSHFLPVKLNWWRQTFRRYLNLLTIIAITQIERLIRHKHIFLPGDSRIFINSGQV